MGNPTYEELEQQIQLLESRLLDAEKDKAAQIQNNSRYKLLFENTHVSVWHEDLSAVVKALDELRAQNVTDLRQYLASHPQLTQEFVQKVKVTHVNSATLQLFGVTEKGMFFDKIDSFFGDDAIEVFIEGLVAIWEKKPSFSSKASYLTADKQKIQAIISFMIPADTADFSCIPVMIQDISDLSYQEDRLTTIIDALSDITFIINEDGQYIEILTSRHELLLDELQKLKGNLFHNVLPRDVADLFLSKVRETIDSGHKLTFEYALELNNGKTWFEGRLSPMKTLIDGKQAVVWIAIDITEHKQIEDQFHQAQKMEAIGLLTGGIAHEFNNMLSPILGYSDLLLDNKSSDHEDFRGLEQIHEAGNRAKALVKQLLAYGGQSISRMNDIQLDMILTEALNMMKNRIPSNIVLELKIEPSLPAIRGMANEMHQIILNLCTNGYQAMPEGGKLIISLKQKNPANKMFESENQQPPGFICLSVTDNGEGMEDHIMDRIFDPFFTTKTVGQGSGLGLSVVQGIVEQHGGKIEIETQPGKGSCFSIYLPLSEKDETDPLIQTNSLKQGGKSIMLIDDEAMILETSRILLQKLNYNVVDFTDCEAALQSFKHQPNNFDLVITDYGMPKMNGKQLSKKIKKIRPDIPVILCTGYGELIAEYDTKTWGVSAILYKPYAIEDMSALIKKLLNT